MGGGQSEGEYRPRGTARVRMGGNLIRDEIIGNAGVNGVDGFQQGLMPLAGALLALAVHHRVHRIQVHDLLEPEAKDIRNWPAVIV